MSGPSREVMERKLAFLRQFIADLRPYAGLSADERRREHYAIERLLQLLCESAADIGLQFLKREGWGLAASYRDVFATLQTRAGLPADLAGKLIEAGAISSPHSTAAPVGRNCRKALSNKPSNSWASAPRPRSVMAP